MQIIFDLIANQLPFYMHLYGGVYGQFISNSCHNEETDTRTTLNSRMHVYALRVSELQMARIKKNVYKQSRRCY